MNVKNVLENKQVLVSLSHKIIKYNFNIQIVMNKLLLIATLCLNIITSVANVLMGMSGFMMKTHKVDFVRKSQLHLNYNHVLLKLTENVHSVMLDLYQFLKNTL